MKTAIGEVIQVNVEDIKVFVSRARRRDGFEQLKASILQVGLIMPVQVRDISERPTTERKRESGGHYKWELICGEGRLTAHKELGLKKISATVVKAPEGQIISRFLAENLVRKELPWMEKGRMVKAAIDAGSTIEEVAALFMITTGHASKLLRVIDKTAPELTEEVSAMPLADAEALTAMPADHQVIVMETLRENPTRQVSTVLKKARALTAEGVKLSPMALKGSMDRVEEELRRTRESLKLVRLHHSLGPQNILTLIENKKIRSALVAAGVNVKKFETLIAQ